MSTITGYSHSPCPSTCGCCKQRKLLFAWCKMEDADPAGGNVCTALANMYAWMTAQQTNFTNDSDYPWGTLTYAIFNNIADTTPAQICQCPENTLCGGTCGVCSSVVFSGCYFLENFPSESSYKGNYCVTGQFLEMCMVGFLSAAPIVVYPCFSGFPFSVCSTASTCAVEPYALDVGCPGISSYYIALPSLDDCAGYAQVCGSGSSVLDYYVPSMRGDCADYSCDLYNTGDIDYSPCSGQWPDPSFGAP